MTIERIKDFISKKEEGISDVFNIEWNELDDIEEIVVKNGGIFLSSEDLQGNLRQTMAKREKHLGAVYVYDIKTDSYKVKIVYKK